MKRQSEIHQRMMRGESIPAYRPGPVTIYRPMDLAGTVLELADALHRLRAIAPTMCWNDDSPDIGEFDAALAEADAALENPGIAHVRGLQGKLL